MTHSPLSSHTGEEGSEGKKRKRIEGEEGV
jgi:hypothetical protein